MQQAEEESKEINEENIRKTKELRAERAKSRAKALDKINSMLPNAENPEMRARLIKQYLNEHGKEIIAESERYTLGEIKTEVDLHGSVKGEKAKSFLAKYAEAEMVAEDFERNTEEGIRTIYTGLAEGFIHLLIPGYSAYADGGSPKEVIQSAGSDIILTYCGGKLVKLVWKVSKNIGAKFSSVLKPKTTKVTHNLTEAERKGFRGVRGKIELKTPKGMGRKNDKSDIRNKKI